MRNIFTEKFFRKCVPKLVLNLFDFGKEPKTATA